ncbi:ABC transporter ATP-binding protein [Hydrogenibacillus sp. N12]|uniref:ABC transporter ATP-binding protein n=1 Tax=Hydrogenibacillus sp. N12 TaxID=2866627 RepID=UPI001C7D3A0B|nr:ABC transporter ATP-binding protein [Hydrogenibacillus sp. N12]QZA31985.1 ABC transporter ATP-binding protein [Hydrogenibacillus sp. N12]
MTEPLLTLNGVMKRFGGVVAVQGVTFDVRPQEIVALIGPNGAGKTTLFNMISGIFSPTAGEIRFAGRPIHGLSPHAIARLGMTRTFQNLKIFYNMTVLENVLVGLNVRLKTRMLAAGLRLPRVAEEERRARDMALHWLDRVGLAALADRPAATLSYGQLKLLEVARAAVSQPAMILLDEPMAGLNPAESQALVRLMLAMREEGTTLLFVEHDMEAVMTAADRIVVLDYGRMIAVGPPAEIAVHPEVIRAYLGAEIEVIAGAHTQ